MAGRAFIVQIIIQRMRMEKIRSKKRISLEPGQTVEVVSSWHSDVTPGAVGTVVKKIGRGYAVEFTGLFTTTSKGNVWVRVLQTRCLFFNHREIRILQRTPLP